MILLEDYKVSLTEKVIPATDLLGQIPTAGTGAPGTSNMKFAMSGALTTGTCDGASIRIREAAGIDNFYLLSAVAEEIEESRCLGYYHDFYYQNLTTARVADTLVSELFTSDRELFASPYHMLIEDDHYCHLLGFDSYCQAQRQAMADLELPEQWHRRASFNICRMGEFSSDRTIHGYARDI